MNIIKKIVEWLSKSNRWKHLVFAMPIGLICNGWYMALVAGASVGGAMEFKDYQWGGKPDVIDAACTLCGVIVGYLLQLLFVILWRML